MPHTLCVMVYITLVSHIWKLVPPLVEQFRRIKRHGFVGGGVSLEVDFEAKNPHTILNESFFVWHSLLIFASTHKLSATASVLCLPAAVFSSMILVESSPGTVNPQLNAFFYKLRLSWCLFVAVQQWQRHSDNIKFSAPRFEVCLLTRK